MRGVDSYNRVVKSMYISIISGGGCFVLLYGQLNTGRAHFLIDLL